MKTEETALRKTWHYIQHKPLPMCIHTKQYNRQWWKNNMCWADLSPA